LILRVPDRRAKRVGTTGLAVSEAIVRSIPIELLKEPAKHKQAKSRSSAALHAE
jgi:hypothetical protein